MTIHRRAALVALIGALGALGVSGAALAQLKPTGPGTAPLPPSGMDLQQSDAQAFKELQARVAAERWLAILDTGDYGRAWDQTAKVFREKVTRAQWVEGLPKTRGVLGAMRSRRVEVASWKDSVAGMPAGDYVTVRFATSFDTKDDAQEIVTLVLEDGAWRPLGYGIA
jgi:hypothetical protein